MSTKAKAAKHVSDEVDAAWQRDQLDPDNWFQANLIVRVHAKRTNREQLSGVR